MNEQPQSQTQEIVGKPVTLADISQLRKKLAMMAGGAGIFFIATFLILPSLFAVITVLIAAGCIYQLFSVMGKLQRAQQNYYNNQSQSTQREETAI